MIKPKIPMETALFLRKAHRIAEDKRKKESKEKCRKFKSKKNLILKEELS